MKLLIVKTHANAMSLNLYVFDMDSDKFAIYDLFTISYNVLVHSSLFIVHMVVRDFQ